MCPEYQYIDLYPLIDRLSISGFQMHSISILILIFCLTGCIEEPHVGTLERGKASIETPQSPLGGAGTGGSAGKPGPKRDDTPIEHPLGPITIPKLAVKESNQGSLSDLPLESQSVVGASAAHVENGVEGNLVSDDSSVAGSLASGLIAADEQLRPPQSVHHAESDDDALRGSDRRQATPHETSPRTQELLHIESGDPSAKVTTPALNEQGSLTPYVEDRFQINDDQGIATDGVGSQSLDIQGMSKDSSSINESEEEYSASPPINTRPDTPERIPKLEIIDGLFNPSLALSRGLAQGSSVTQEELDQEYSSDIQRVEADNRVSIKRSLSDLRSREVRSHVGRTLDAADTTHDKDYLDPTANEVVLRTPPLINTASYTNVHSDSSGGLDDSTPGSALVKHPTVQSSMGTSLEQSLVLATSAFSVPQLLWPRSCETLRSLTSAFLCGLYSGHAKPAIMLKTDSVAAVNPTHRLRQVAEKLKKFFTEKGSRRDIKDIISLIGALSPDPVRSLSAAIFLLHQLHPRITDMLLDSTDEDIDQNVINYMYQVGEVFYQIVRLGEFKLRQYLPESWKENMSHVETTVRDFLPVRFHGRDASVVHRLESKSVVGASAATVENGVEENFDAGHSSVDEKPASGPITADEQLRPPLPGFKVDSSEDLEPTANQFAADHRVSTLNPVNHLNSSSSARHGNAPPIEKSSITGSDQGPILHHSDVQSRLRLAELNAVLQTAFWFDDFLDREQPDHARNDRLANTLRSAQRAVGAAELADSREHLQLDAQSSDSLIHSLWVAYWYPEFVLLGRPEQLAEVSVGDRLVVGMIDGVSGGYETECPSKFESLLAMFRCSHDDVPDLQDIPENAFEGLSDVRLLATALRLFVTEGQFSKEDIQAWFCCCRPLARRR